MRYALINAVLLDGTENMEPRRGMSVLVENGRIASICEDACSFGKVKTIDLEGGISCPGL